MELPGCDVNVENRSNHLNPILLAGMKGHTKVSNKKFYSLIFQTQFLNLVFC